MKKLLFSIVAIALLGVTTVSAQGFKGKWFILGEAEYSTQQDGDVQNYSILPVVGTFIAPTTAVGLGIGYIGSNTDKGNDNSLKTGSFLVQPLVRKYWGLTDNFFFFGQAAVPLAFGKETTEENNVKTDVKTTKYGVAISPGIDYFLSKNFSIEASVGLVGWTAVKPKDGDTTNDFAIGLNSGFQNGVKFGVKYVF